MKRLLLGLFLLLPSPLWGAGVKGAKVYKPFEPIILKASDITTKDAQFLWDVSGEAKVEEAGATLYVWAPPGTYQVKLTAIDFTAKKVERATFSFTVEGTVPPGPTPIPPGPVPPTPVPGKGNHVLIIEETNDRSKLPIKQLSQLFDQEFHAWLKANTLVDAENRNGAWNIWDKDTDASMMPKIWPDLLKRSRQSLPWVIVAKSDGSVVYEGALPVDAQATKTLLSQYLGK